MSQLTAFAQAAAPVPASIRRVSPLGWTFGTSPITAVVSKSDRCPAGWQDLPGVRQVFVIEEAAPADLNAAQLEAIAWADAHLNNAGLPTYSQLLAAGTCNAPACGVGRG